MVAGRTHWGLSTEGGAVSLASCGKTKAPLLSVAAAAASGMLHALPDQHCSLCGGYPAADLAVAAVDGTQHADLAVDETHHARRDWYAD